MSAATSLEQLVVPPSIFKIAQFLSDVRDRSLQGNSTAVADAWERHAISVTDIGGFLDWLHVDRALEPKKEASLSQVVPEKSLAKAADSAPDEEEREAGSARDQDAADSVNVHLWHSLFRAEPKRRRREMPSAPLLPVGERGKNLSQGRGGNILFASMFLNADAEQVARTTDGGTHPELIDGFEGLAPVGPHGARSGTNGIAAQAFGNRVTNRVEGVPPQWNAPMRRDLMPTFGLANLSFKGPEPTSPEPAPVADPLFGQITLVAPSLTVAPEQSDVGMNFDWRDMAKGAGQLDYAGLVNLAKSLPEGSKVLYPAIDPRQLRGGSVNLRLDPRLATGLVAQGYGTPARVDAWKSARMASDWYGGTPPAQRLPGKVTPLNRPGKKGEGIVPDGPSKGVGSDDPARRMRFNRFLGLPIYFSQNLNTSPELEHETRARVTAEFMPRAPVISPLNFAGLRTSLLRGFHGVQAQPDSGAWRVAAPSYDRAGSALSALLLGRLGGGIGSAAPATATVPGLRMPGPIGLPSRPSISSLPTQALSLGTEAAPGLRGSFARPSLPSRGAFAPPTSVGTTAAAGELPRFIRPRSFGVAPSPPEFQPSIPVSSQSATAPVGQSATAPQGAGEGSGRPLRMSPQITVAAEKPTSRSKSPPATQSAPSAPPAQSMPPEGPKPARTPMVPGLQAPRSTALPSKATPKPAAPKSEVRAPTDVPYANSSTLKPPTMQVAPPIKSPSVSKPESEPIAIQTSTSSPGGAAAESGAARTAEVAEKKENALPGSEINLLANEVWVLLKRRLAFEAQRMGR